MELTPLGPVNNLHAREHNKQIITSCTCRSDKLFFL